MKLVWVVLTSPLAVVCLAQDFRATLNGRVTDPTGAAVPSVSVAVRNTGTNELVTVATDAQGNYIAPLLKPGSYSVTVESAGFRSASRDGLTLNVGQRATVDFHLELGAVTEQVVVTAETPMLETSSADRGGVIDNERVAEFPLNARNPFMLSMLVAGVNYNGNIIYQRPFDNGAIADWSINGSRNRQNEFLLDGAPNNAQAGGNNLAYVPPVDAVQEFKIQTNSFDAQYGKTGGGIVNVSLKSGGNAIHGTAYEFARRNAWDANSFQNNARGAPKDGHFLDQYGFQISGPIVLPKIWDGHNKSFYMVNYEGYREGTPYPLNLSVPELEMRDGDFSKLTDPQGRRITIYDPATGRDVNGQWVRTSFPGNIIPKDRVNPIARNITSYYPNPNTVTPGVGYSQTNFFVPGGQNSATDDFYNIAFKYDQNLGDRHRLFFRYASNDRTEMRNTNGIMDSPGQDGPQPLKRINDTYVLDWVGTLSNIFIANFRLSFNRYIEGSRGDANAGFDMRTLGFSDSFVRQLPHGPFFGRYEIESYLSLGRYPNMNYTNTWAAHPNFTRAQGTLTIKTGVDMRWVQYATKNYGNVLLLGSNRSYTQREFNRGDALSGNPLASFLLGTPSSASVAYNTFPIFMYRYFAPWVQTDWKAMPRLTINLGLRWDLNTPPNERYNRMNRGFNLDVLNPVDAMVDHKKYPELPVLRGSLLFAGVDGQPARPADVDWNNVQPRAGFAYQLSNRVVMRGGWGRYFLNPNNDYLQMNGFSQGTPYVTSLDGNRTIIPNTINNLFPGGVLVPPGASLGALSYIGRGFNFFRPDFQIPYVNQFSLGFQVELPGRSHVEITYSGSRSKQQQENRSFNDYPPDLRDRCSYFFGGNPAYCDERLPYNPFYGLAPWEGTGTYSATTTTRTALARPYPHFGGLTEYGRNDGAMWYNSMQIAWETRGKGGLNLSVSYTLSKHMERSGWLDSVRGVPQQSLIAYDHPHRLVIGSIYKLPFGKGRRWFQSNHSIWGRLISGWENTVIFSYTSGNPADLPNGIYLKNAVVGDIDWSAPRVKGMEACNMRWNEDNTITPVPFSAAAGCTGYYFLGLPRYTARKIPNRDGKLRLHTVPQMDMSLNKTTIVTEKLKVQFRAEAFNVTNTYMFYKQTFSTDLESPNFGTLVKSAVGAGNSNWPRYVQLGVKLIW
jgi:hypothetical protein